MKKPQDDFQLLLRKHFGLSFPTCSICGTHHPIEHCTGKAHLTILWGLWLDRSKTGVTYEIGRQEFWQHERQGGRILAYNHLDGEIRMLFHDPVPTPQIALSFRSPLQAKPSTEETFPAPGQTSDRPLSAHSNTHSSAHDEGRVLLCLRRNLKSTADIPGFLEEILAALSKLPPDSSVSIEATGSGRKCLGVESF